MNGSDRLIRYLPAALIFSAGVFLSLYLARMVAVKEQALVRAEFERRAVRTVTVLQEGIDHQMEVLASIAGLYAASREVERVEFRDFTRPALARHPEIQALEWIPRVRASERRMYEENARGEGFPGFVFTERGRGGSLVRAGRRPEYFPVYFVEPLRGNEEALGFDLASDARRLAALEQARDEGEMIATAPIDLVQGSLGGPGLLVFQPIYRKGDARETRRNRLIGFGLGAYRIRGMLTPLFREGGIDGVEAVVFDRRAESGTTFLYGHREATDERTGALRDETMARIRSGIHLDAEVDVPGRRWSVTLFPSAMFLTSHSGLQRWGVLAGGLLVSVLLGAFIVGSLRRSERIEQLAAVLSKSNEDLQREIAERKATERRIADALELNRKIIEASPLGICTYDASGQCLSANEAAGWILGATKEQLLRQNILRIESLRDAGVRNMVEKILAGEPGGQQEIHIVTTFGKEVWLDLRFAPFIAGGAPCLLLIIEDMTDRKRAEEALRRSEEQLRHAQKMEAVGQLAGGVAHDFNNLLLVITGYASLLLAQLPEEDPRRKEAEEILSAGDRAAALTRQLLAFSRRQVLQPKELDLNRLLSAMVGMLRRLIGEHIELVEELSAGLWKVKADPGQIEQILVNLSVNARDAMPGGGTLTIRTSNLYPDARLIQDHASMVPGGHVLIEVTDTGTGMDEETRSHIFEPFFTTKETGKGTGLGMATVYGIVNQSRGHIGVESEVGRGTTVRIYFPRAEETGERDSATEETAEEAESPHPGRETILLVEDEPSVRELVREILTGLGYRVLEAGDGEEALQRSERHAGTVDLLISDVVMPRMGGPALWERLSAGRPGLKALFISGYARDALDEGTLERPGCGFLQKPFAPERIAAMVRQVLDVPGESVP